MRSPCRQQPQKRHMLRRKQQQHNCCKSARTSISGSMQTLTTSGGERYAVKLPCPIMTSAHCQCQCSKLTVLNIYCTAKNPHIYQNVRIDTNPDVCVQYLVCGVNTSTVCQPPTTGTLCAWSEVKGYNGSNELYMQ